MKTVIVQTGDRWDTLAYELLGDSAYAVDLMEANASLVGIDIDIPSGVEIRLPDEVNTININTNILPPWQR